MRLPPSSSSSFVTSKKFKTMIHNFIFSHICRFTHTFTKAKSIVIDIFKETRMNNIKFLELLILKRNKNKKKIYFGSFRLHHNWCSSHVVPVTSLEMQDALNNHVYYGSTWNSSYVDDHEMVLESQLTGYLHWLEEKNKGESGFDQINEIDRLADKFIANSHEKFMLEKQESYRRFQEMMARSV